MLLDEYNGEKPSELKYKDEIFNQVNQMTINLENLITQNPHFKKQKSCIINTKEELTLFDIWLEKSIDGKKIEYDNAISFLEKNYNKFDISFVSKLNGRLEWNNMLGSQQYMAGFIHVLMTKKWISTNHSAPKLVKILFNTFNVLPNIKSFKSINTNPPKLMYVNPFMENIKENPKL